MGGDVRSVPMMAFLAGMSVAFGPARADEAAKDREKLQGTWEVRHVVSYGEPTPKEKLKGAKVVFQGSRVVFSGFGGAGEQTSEFQLNPTRDPKAIDLVPVEGKYKGKSTPGIYRLEGDTLTLCVRQLKGGPNLERPAALASKRGDGVTLYTLVRSRP